MLFDDDGNFVILEPHAGSYGGARFGDYFAFRDLLAQWRERGDFAGLALERTSTVTVTPGTGNRSAAARSTPHVVISHRTRTVGASSSLVELSTHF